MNTVSTVARAVGRSTLTIVLVLLVQAAPPVRAEQCLDIWASVEWNDLPIHAITLMLPVETRSPRIFRGGRGFDHVVRFETELGSGGEVLLGSTLVGPPGRCEGHLEGSQSLTIGDQLDVGMIMCGADRYRLRLDVRTVRERPLGCW